MLGVFGRELWGGTAAESSAKNLRRGQHLQAWRLFEEHKLLVLIKRCSKLGKMTPVEALDDRAASAPSLGRPSVFERVLAFTAI